MADYAAVFDGVSGKGTFATVTYSNNTDIKVKMKFNANQASGIISNGGAGIYFRYASGSLRFRSSGTNYSTWSFTPVLGQEYVFDIQCRSSGVELFIDTVSQGVKNGIFGTWAVNTIALYNTSNYASATIERVTITDNSASVNDRDWFNDVSAGSNVNWKDQSANAQDATLVDTATDGSQWELIGGGGGVTVTADSQDYNVTFYDASIEFAGEVSVTGESQAHSVTFYDATIDLTGEVLVNAETQSYQVQFFDGQVSLVSGIEVQAQAQSYDVIFYDALVQLSGTININADSQAYSVTFYDGTVVIADVWTDKPKAVTSWANQSSVATIWTDK